MSESPGRRHAAASAQIPHQIHEAAWCLSDGTERGRYGHSIALGTRSGGTLVRLIGDLDLMAEPDLKWVLETLFRLDSLPVEVDLSDVTFMDTTGLRPLVEATRRRQVSGRSALVVTHCSVPVLRLLDVIGIGIGAESTLDVSAWDLLGGSFTPAWAGARHERVSTPG